MQNISRLRQQPITKHEAMQDQDGDQFDAVLHRRKQEMLTVQFALPSHTQQGRRWLHS